MGYCSCILLWPWHSTVSPLYYYHSLVCNFILSLVLCYSRDDIGPWKGAAVLLQSMSVTTSPYYYSVLLHVITCWIIAHYCLTYRWVMSEPSDNTDWVRYRVSQVIVMYLLNTSQRIELSSLLLVNNVTFISDYRLVVCHTSMGS